MEKIKLGVSACLLGENVRYDGGHSHDRFLTDTLGQYIEYVPVCPEVECGLPVPREAMHLEGDPGLPRLVTINTRQDMTDRLQKWARRRAIELEKNHLCGFIFKSKSPSSGMERVKVYNDKGVPAKKGVGLFAGIFMEHFPLLPVEDEGRLCDPILRNNFVERIFVSKRWSDVLKAEKSLGSLIDFHTRHKLLILSHSPGHYKTMGRFLAAAKAAPIKELYRQYQSILMDALKLKATPNKNANVLMHMMGYFKKQLSPEEKAELLEVIDNHRKGNLPLIVPITLINHYVRKYNQTYLQQQVFLNPHPLELQLRNHV
jgi:uncharacterized protein YbgA (DUF1722 family)/uncharacterized protein YbbK (DUF523 family)